MSSLAELNRFLANMIEKEKLTEIDAISAAKWLDDAGLLKDSKHRPGLPLRKYLRAGKISGAYQYPNRRWVIRRSNKESIYSVKEAAKELGLSDHAIYKRIDKGLIKSEILGEKNIVIPKSEIIREKQERNPDINIDQSGEIHYNIATIKNKVLGLKKDFDDILYKIDILENLMGKKKMNISFNDINELKENGFDGFYSIESIITNKDTVIPKTKGVYLVLYPSSIEPDFLEKNIGGHFKAKDPTVDVNILKERWINNTIVAYIGQAGGGKSKATLKSRISQLLEFGNGSPVGHWGGRYLWQIKDSNKLVICWKPYPDDDPNKVESDLIGSFIEKYGMLPFANLKKD